MESEVKKSILRVKREIDKETDINYTRLRGKIRMKFDTSDYVTEKELLIECENRKWRLVAYLSKSLNKTERNYKIYNKEMLAVI